MCRSRQAAEDLVHDTFVALLRGPHLFDPQQGSVYGYLCGILRHPHQPAFPPAKHPGCAGGRRAFKLPRIIPPRRRNRALGDHRGVPPRAAQLPVPHREIIALCDLEELPYHAVADILQCPIGTVRSRLHRARALLTLRLASLELVDLENDPPLVQPL